MIPITFDPVLHKYIRAVENQRSVLASALKSALGLEHDTTNADDMFAEKAEDTGLLRYPVLRKEYCVHKNNEEKKS